MTNPAKLYALLMHSTNRSIDFRDFIAIVGRLASRTPAPKAAIAHSPIQLAQDCWCFSPTARKQSATKSESFLI